MVDEIQPLTLSEVLAAYDRRMFSHGCVERLIAELEDGVQVPPSTQAWVLNEMMRNEVRWADVMQRYTATGVVKP